MSTVILVDPDDFFLRLEEIIEAKLRTILEKKEEGAHLPDWMTRKQAAEYLSVSMATLDNLARVGVLRKHRMGSTVRFKKEELIHAFKNWQRYKRF